MRDCYQSYGDRKGNRCSRAETCPYGREPYWWRIGGINSGEDYYDSWNNGWTARLAELYSFNSRSCCWLVAFEERKEGGSVLCGGLFANCLQWYRRSILL